MYIFLGNLEFENFCGTVATGVYKLLKYALDSLVSLPNLINLKGPIFS